MVGMLELRHPRVGTRLAECYGEAPGPDRARVVLSSVHEAVFGSGDAGSRDRDLYA